MKAKPRHDMGALKARRAKLRAENRCVFCGGKLPDPAVRKKQKLEEKIARLQDQLRLLTIPPIPKGEGLGDDTPLGRNTMRRTA